MPKQRILYLSQSDVASTGVTMKEIIDTLEVAFREHGEGRVEMPPKPGVHTRPDAFIHAMPAYIPALRAVGDLHVRFLPYSELESHRDSIARFGHGMKPIEAIARSLA